MRYVAILAALVIAAIGLPPGSPERGALSPANAGPPGPAAVKAVVKYSEGQTPAKPPAMPPASPAEVKLSDFKPRLQQPEPMPGPKPAPKPPKLTLPEEVHVAPGELGQVLIETEPGVQLHYQWVGSKTANVFREFDPDPGHVSYQVLGRKAGTFHLVVFAVKDGQVAKAVCTVIVDGPTPPAPTPPGPGPGPSPIPPGPHDPLVDGLQAAYNADPAPAAAKQKARDSLIGLYQAMQTQTAAGKFATLADVRKGLSTAAAGMALGDSLLAVRKLIAAEIMAATGPAPDAKLEPALQAKVAGVFGRVAACLAAIK